MKSIIVYYSVSGNTKKIAQAMQKGMSKLVEQCDITSIRGTVGIPKMGTKDLIKYDLIGFGSPVWNLLPSPNMMAFIKSLPSLEGKHAFVFLTHGILPGISMRWTVKTLQSKHANVIGWNDWYGGCSPPDMFKPYYTDGHPDEIDLKEADDFSREMVENSRRILAGETDLIPTLPRGKEYNNLYGYRRYTKPYTYDTSINMEKCNQCGLCVENCPTGSIDLSATPPVDTSTCEYCSLCEQICPLGAVEVDFDGMVARNEIKWGKHRERLNYFKKTLKRVMNDPRFRKLVPLEDVGKDGYWYQISKHPRIKIPK